MAAIFVASSIPDLTRLPGDIPDHTGHFAAYAVLGLLMLRAHAAARWEAITLGACCQAWLWTAAYGVSDEWHQRFVAGRSAALDDVIADAAGAAAAIAVVGGARFGLRLADREV
jgi:VanZ family protein